MYSYRQKIDYYQDNRTFLSKSYSTKNDFLKQYNKLYNDKEKSKQLYLQVLCELKVAVSEGNIESFKNTSKILNYIIDTENADLLSSYFDEDINPLKNTNLIILACKYNQLKILKYIFSNYSSLYERLCKNENRSTTSNYEDGTCHNAFYYSIRSGNRELLETLISKWPGNYFESHPNELDEILSKAYEELKLKNVLLSESMEFLVEEKLINLRFFFNPSNQSPSNKNSLNNITERIELVIEQIDSLNFISEVNEEFLLILKYIAQNIFVLKRQLKVSYDTLPWEEMEFSLICFITSFTKDEEITIHYRVVLNKAQILKHLQNFAIRLGGIKNVIKTCKINLSLLPNISREQAITQILEKYPDFAELYQDYQKIRDIHTLNVINNYVTLVSSIDVKNKKGQLAIIRSLQVIGECLKNTLEAPKLSAYTMNLLFLSLTKSTRKLVIKLRNSLSHAYSLDKRIEVLQNENVSFFEGIQNDIKKIGLLVKDILYKNNLRTMKNIFESIVNCKDGDELRQIVSLGNLFNFKLLKQIFPSEKNHLTEYERLKSIIQELKNIMPDQTEEEKRILQQMEEILSVQNVELSNTLEDYAMMTIQLSTLQHNTEAFSIDNNCLRSYKYSCNQALNYLNSRLVQTKDLKSLNELFLKLFKRCELKENCDEQNVIKNVNTETYTKLILEIFYIFDVQFSNIHCVSKLTDKLMERTCNDDQSGTIQTFKNTREKAENQLASKVLELKKIIAEYNLSKWSANFTTCTNSQQVLAALEMLILEILSILGDVLNRVKDNLHFLDENIPLLIGKNLRNHLAHGNAILDIIPSSQSVGLIVTARKFAEELDRVDSKIGKSETEDLKKLKNKIDLKKQIISTKQKMFDALESGDFESLRSCIAQGADVHARKNNMWTALEAAAQGGNLDIVKFLIDQKVNIQVESLDGKNPLHVAAACGNSNVVGFFLKQKYYDVKDKDELNKTPLHLAALNNKKAVVETLIKHNANCSAKDRLGFSPLHYAVQENHKEVAEILLKKEKTVDANEMKGGFTALHVASERGRVELVKFLLDRGANVHAKTDAKTTPLHLASLNGHTEVVVLLIKKKSNVNARVREGCTPLHYAVENGHKEIADILLKNGADPNVSDKAYYNAPVHYVAKDGHADILQALISYKANINAPDVHNKTPLFHAIINGHLKIVKIICQQNNTIRHVEDPLHLATASGHVQIVDYLISLVNIDVSTEDDDGNTPLHLAAIRGQYDMVELFLKNKAKINVKNKQGLTPLLAAVGVDRKSIDDLNNIPLCFRDAFDNKNNEREKIVKILLQNGADINVKLVSGITILHLAAATGNCSMIELLIRLNIPINSKSNYLGTPLHVAVTFGCKEVVNLLLENGADVNATSERNLTALCLAVKGNHADIVNILMTNKTQVVKVNEDDVKVAIHNNNNDILKILLKYSQDTKDIIKNYTFEGCSLLYLAVMKCNEDIIQTLIANGADVNCKGNENRTPLFMAVISKREKVIKILLDNGADVNCTSSGLTLLHVAAKHSSSEIVEILLKQGVDVNAKDDKNRTALELAVADENFPIVKILLPQMKMHINNKGNSGFTILHIAAQFNNHLEVIKYLVTNGADINSRNENGSKPIHIAAREGHEETVKYFLSLGQNVDELGASNGTLLHCCSIYSKVKLAEYLIKKGANVNAKSMSNRTPLHSAVENRPTLNFIKLLLEHGAMYNTKDIFGFKPISISKDAATTNFLSSIDKLFQAVKENNVAEVKKCIKDGAFVNALNSDNVTSLHFAAWKGYDEIVTELVQAKNIVNVVGKKGLTPLHYAAKFGHFNVCKILLAAGAIYNVKGENEKTPLDFSENKEVSDLLRLIHSCFDMVSNKNTKIFGVLKKIKDVSVVKAIMNADNGEGKSLIAVAMLNNFPKVDELKQVLQGDISKKIEMAEVLATYEQYDESLKIYKSALKKRTELLGKNNPGSLDMQEKIAGMLYKQQKYEEALGMFQDIYEKQKDLLGEDSKETLNTKSTTALILHRQGKNEEALAIFRQVYEKQKNILTMNDRDFLNTQLHMALVLNALYKFDEALMMNKKVFEQRKKSEGANHPDTLTAQNNIAMVLTNQGQYEQAEKMYRNVYESRKKFLGPTHSDTLRAFHNIVTVLDRQKKYDKAMSAYEEILAVQESCLGSDHIDTLQTQINMAKLLNRQGKYISALKIFNKCLPIFKNKVGPGHMEVVLCEAMVEATTKVLRISGQSDLIDIINNLNKEARAAVSSGDLKSVQRLLESDVDVNEADEDGRTLLHFAADSGNIDVTRALLNSGGIVNKVTKKGNTPLHTAVAKGHQEIAEEFLKHVNRDLLAEFMNAKTNAGSTTALHVAAKGGNYEIVKMLLKYGAEYGPKNNEGKTPLSISQNQKVIHLLKEIDSFFIDVTKGNVEVIRKLRELKKDELLATINARDDKYMCLMQVAILRKHRQIGKDLLMLIKETT